jgi:hypothetical protein
MPARITDEMTEQFRRQNYTVRAMFGRVQRLFKYLGFEALPRSFWTDSIFSRNWVKAQPLTHLKIEKCKFF